ncbi:hypothetical protein AG0111_0g13119 [Alternaria gaisen]|uniref:Uncharacterized protein n=1 Tax=Alternaria gaisen TaxID=167740 RepID=A0ACB6F2L7_9PLEO|nr:hypothetical protein AG0111_0g13119 [Alternaria gaisen]
MAPAKALQDAPSNEISMGQQARHTSRIHPVSRSPSRQERAVKLSPTQSVVRHGRLRYSFITAAFKNAKYNKYLNNTRAPSNQASSFNSHS